MALLFYRRNPTLGPDPLIFDTYAMLCPDFPENALCDAAFKSFYPKKSPVVENLFLFVEIDRVVTQWLDTFEQLKNFKAKIW